MSGRIYGGLLLLLVGTWLLVWGMVRIPTPVSVPTLVSVSKATPALKVAYNTLVQHVKAANGPGWNVALVGHDPCSTGISEGLRADAPWALDLWNSTLVATDGDTLKLKQLHQGAAPEQMSNWDWAIRVINDDSRPEVQSIDNLWLENEPFYVTDKAKSKATAEVQKALALWDDLQVRAYINEYYVESWTSKNTKECPPVTEHQTIRHTIGIVSDQDIATLKSWGYGFPYDRDWPKMQVYGLSSLRLCYSCNDCIEVLLDTAGDAGCDEGVEIMAGSCEALAAFNLFDGFGEVIEFICPVLGGIGAYACGTPDWKGFMHQHFC